MIDDATTEGGVLVRIKVMTRQLTTCHPTDCMDKVLTIEVFETIFIGIMSIGVTVELMSGGVFYPILVMSILGRHQDMYNNWDKTLTQYSSSLNMKGVMAQP